MIEKNKRKVLVGVVMSKSGDKTVKVASFYKAPHPLLKKEIKRKTVIFVHDENNACNVGDKVEVVETRPLSHLKRWRLAQILEVAPQVGVI